MTDGHVSARDPSTEQPSEPLFIPARRFGGEEEMAGTLLYLASRAGAVSAYIIISLPSADVSLSFVSSPPILVVAVLVRAIFLFSFSPSF